MPFVGGTSLETTAAANVIMARAFFRRAQDWLYPHLCSSYVSVKAVEPLVTIGAVPPLRAYTGTLRFKNIPSYNMNVPNLLFKSAFGIQRSAFEFDQTRVLPQLAPQTGIAVAELPDQLVFKRILNGSSASSASVVFDFDGKTYTTTMDGLSYFNTAHTMSDSGGTQSNIIQGNLPNTNALVQAQDIATTAQQIVQDFSIALQTIKDYKNTNGMPIFPNLDTKRSVVIVCPPTLEPAMHLAFLTPGSTIAQTSNIMPYYVRDVFSSGYLDGFPDPEDETGSTNINPVNATDYYIFIVDDFVKPFYMQMFKPVGENDIFPRGYNADGVIDAIRRINKGMTVEQATLFASTSVDTTFRRVGAESDAYTIQNERFLVAGRYRGNLVYGPPFLGYRVKPVGGS